MSTDCFITSINNVKRRPFRITNVVRYVCKPTEITGYLMDSGDIDEFFTNNDEIDRVIFNNPATIVIWSDGTKTVVKCQPGDVYDQEKGLLLCIAKKHFGNKGNFNNELKKFIPELPSVEEMRTILNEFCKKKHCLECELGIDGFRCGRGTHFYSRCNGKYTLIDAEIQKMYNYVFGKKGGLNQ